MLSILRSSSVICFLLVMQWPLRHAVLFLFMLMCFLPEYCLFKTTMPQNLLGNLNLETGLLPNNVLYTCNGGLAHKHYLGLTPYH